MDVNQYLNIFKFTRIIAGTTVDDSLYIQSDKQTIHNSSLLADRQTNQFMTVQGGKDSVSLPRSRAVYSFKISF